MELPHLSWVCVCVGVTTRSHHVAGRCAAQDWEFPEFRTDLDIKLPGVKSANVSFQLCRMCSRFHITGKWFNYGILFLVMALDLNMSKNMVTRAHTHTHTQHTACR